MKLSVHLLRRPAPDTLAHLRAELDAEIHLTLGPALPVPAGYEILVVGRPQREHLTASPNLRALVIPFAGLPDVTRELMRHFPHIAVHNLHYNAMPVAEMVITLMLAAAKFIIPMDRTLRNHDWTLRYRRPSPSILLEDKTAMILGYGAIGRRVAHLCRALGMKVLSIRRQAPYPVSLGHRPHLKWGRTRGWTRCNVAAPPPDAPDEIYPPDALHSLLPRADALLICLPHTPETTGLVGERELALLPSSAVLVNIGRGPIVDEAALYHALRDGTLHAAGLDVWYNYPADEAARSRTPPSAYPFHELDNVVMSPHRAGHFDETETLRMTYLAASLNAAARGEELPDRVNLKAGY